MNLLKAASTVSLWTLLSRITGLVRDQLIAASFGASAVTDAFNVAFRIPNLLRRLFGEGAFSAAFVPILAATREREGDEVTRRLIDAVGTVLLWVLVATCVVGVLAAPAVVWLFGAGLEEFDLAVVLTRWMFPYIGFMSLVALSAGVLNTWKNFALPAATPVLLNVAMIGCSLGLTPVLRSHDIQPIHALSAGVLLGGVLQLAVQIPALARIGALPRIGVLPGALLAAWRHPGVHRVLKQMAPALLGVSVAQASLLINTQIASHLRPGAVSWLVYADRLMEFPTALLGVALGVVLIPGLSALRARGDHAGYSAQLDWGLRLMMLLATPCAVAMLVFAKPLVAVLFHYGKFSSEAVDMTVLALRGYGCGLLGLVGVKVLAPGFFAQQDLRTPVRIAVMVLICTQLMNVIFVPWLGHAGLALSIGLGAMVNAGWLMVGLQKRGLYSPGPGWPVYLARLAPANLALGLWLGWSAQAVGWLDLQAHAGQRAGLLAGVIGVGALLYFGALRLAGLPLKQFLRRT
ncbi:murein biosynthesis integral membrane protein MurJ [Ideonella azotifigens]|uniref:Probable lipid II flippase MurJ n=1 Tax=Ideonella azotifigens TaxID=513160 RepID=A0ABN1JY15_9BURK|nr:murein biosynthesis integral membrane protein MurJ [Ideonella azotifigens]MCD2341293.1 murein biosynthesis integral membrane protein MurJ [Ideonella azotifigens]